MLNEKKAGLSDGLNEKTHSDHNSAALLRKASPLDDIGEAIEGQRQAMAMIRGLPAEPLSPDALFLLLQDLAAAPSRLRSFCRAIQKFIEGGRP